MFSFTANMKAVQISLGVLLAFVALNAFGGGYYGMSGAKDVPLEWLEGSPFKSYFFPSLFLFVVLGGFSLYSSIAVFRNWKYARITALLCGILMLSWIGVQVAIIGYISWMQPATLIAGIIVLVLAWIFNPGRVVPAQP